MFRGPLRRPARAVQRSGAYAGVFVLLATLLSLVGISVSAPPAQADYATGGAGLYKESIDWFEWGAPNTPIPAAGLTRTNTRVVAGQTLATTCTLGPPSGNLFTYRSGDYSGDALDDLYNIGGTGANNTLIAGLAASGATVNFGFSCSVTLDGTPVPLAGLVMADAEASIATSGEYVQANIAPTATWRIIDRYRSPADCPFSTQATRSAGNTLRLAGDANICASSGPAVVGFMDGASSASVQIHGGGTSAIALGVVLSTDFGDAPASYGAAGSLFSSDFTGGDVPVGTTEVSEPGFPLATTSPPATRLGATVDSEVAYPPSDADADGADEDAITPPDPIHVTPGLPYTLDGVQCTGPGAVAGWIDWNRNGVFDAGERSNTAICVGGSVSLTWAVPFDTKTSTGASHTFMRLRIGPDAASIASPTGLTTAGEVEDYAVNVQLPRVTIDKSSDATTATRVGDTVNYTVEVRNPGPTDFTADYPANVQDDLTNILDDATYNDDATADGGSLSYVSPKLRWTGPLAAGETVTITYSVKLNKVGDQNVDNIAYQTECDASDPACDPPPPEVCTNGIDPATGLACDREEFDLPHLTIEKTSPDLQTARPGETIHYEITVSNDGEAPFTDARPAGFIDDMTSVLDDGNFNNDATASFGDVEFSDPKLVWTGALGVGQSATITYSVVYTGLGDNQVDNVVFEPGCDPREDDCDPPPPPCDVEGSGTDPSTGLSVDCLRWPKPNLELDKTSPDISSARFGDTVTYVVTATNTGPGDYTEENPAAFVDDLSGVLDDATYNDDASVPSGALSYEEPKIRWVGTLASGESVEITYTVTLTDGGDRKVKNVAFGTLCDGRDPDCEDPPTPKCPPEGKNPDSFFWVSCLVEKLPELKIKKSSPNLASSRVGDTVDYKVTLTNVGPGDFTAERLARAIDDLSGVLDDATYNDDAEASSGDVSYSEPRIVWTGKLAAGESVTITYSVTLTGEGDKSVKNVAFEPPCDPIEEGCDPPTPDCPPDETSQVDSLAVTCVEEELPELEIEKSSPNLATSQVGDTVDYEVTLTNVGPGDFTAERLARVIDDLSGVLDDARYNRDAEASSGRLSYSKPRIVWTGKLAAGEKVTITYSVTLTGDGDQSVMNVVFEPPCDPTKKGCDPPTPVCEDGIDPQTGLACDDVTEEVPGETEPPPDDGEDLPDTGSQVSGPIIAGGVLLVLLGTGAVLLARRRSNL